MKGWTVLKEDSIVTGSLYEKHDYWVMVLYGLSAALYPEKKYPPNHPAWYAEKPLRSLSGGAISESPSLAGNNIVHQVIRIT